MTRTMDAVLMSISRLGSVVRESATPSAGASLAPVLKLHSDGRAA